VRIYRVSQQLGAEREYKNGESFSFKLEIPEQAFPPNSEGASSFQSLFVRKPRNFYIEAKMDVPMSPDINSRITVYLRR
jgi:hypothetical protein